ncbi:MAG: dethiobiotin synthase [Pseudomonadota bacterium]
MTAARSCNSTARGCAVADGWFVTGTDTGVGKTLVAAALIVALRRSGRRVAPMKPVAAGTENGRCADVDTLMAASGGGFPPDLVNPYCFPDPIAPHVAAARAGVRIAPERIVAAYRRLQAAADAVVVEGAGGFRVPLGPAVDFADVAQQLGLPVILVVRIRLGCLNHALLTAEAVGRRGLALAGWVANAVDPGMAAVRENVEALAERLPGPLLGEIPVLADADPAVAADRLQGFLPGAAQAPGGVASPLPPLD